MKEKAILLLCAATLICSGCTGTIIFTIPGATPNAECLGDESRAFNLEIAFHPSLSFEGASNVQVGLDLYQTPEAAEEQKSKEAIYWINFSLDGESEDSSKSYTRTRTFKVFLPPSQKLYPVLTLELGGAKIITQLDPIKVPDEAGDTVTIEILR